jgi:hypothetical protein
MSLARGFFHRRTADEAIFVLRSPPFEKKIEEVPSPGLQCRVERSIPFELKPVSTSQEEERE